jgi:hypothetical protein
LFKPSISADGRYVGYSTNTGGGAFVYDTCTGAPTTCVSGSQRLDASFYPDQSQVSLSADGRFAVFLSGLFACGDWDYGCDLRGQTLLADTCAGASTACTPNSQEIGTLVPALIQTDTGDVLLHPAISPDGRAILLNASLQDLQMLDSCRGGPAGCVPMTISVSLSSDGSPANAESFGGTVSAGGRYVAFLSMATNLVPGITVPNILRIYLRDTCISAPSGCTPATTFVSVAGDGTISADEPSISVDGRYIAFASGAADSVPGDTNGALDVFVRDTCAGVASGCSPSTTRVSVALDGTQGSADSFRPAISGDGKYVVFISAAKLGPGAPNKLGGDVYLARH